MSSFNVGEFKVSVVAYAGRYGPEGCNGDVISTTTKCGDICTSYTPTNKEVIFVVDCSGSMHESIPELQAGLLAFRDIIIDRNSRDDIRSSEEVEKEFGKTVSARLIVYSDIAREIYPYKSPSGEVRDWNTAVRSMIASGLTNIGEGVELAYSKSTPNKCTWIVMMTDGCPNRGNYQSEDSFNILKKRAPSHVRLLTLGYGTEYNSVILMKLGEFTPVESREYIPVVFGSITNELKYTWGFDARWKPKNRIYGSKYIVGSPTIGCLYKQKKYITGILLENTPVEWSSIEMMLSFISVQTMEEISIPFSVKVTNFPPPEEFREKYYLSAKGRRLNKLYEISNMNIVRPENIQIVCKNIRDDIDKWEENCAIPHKEELLRIIETIEYLYTGGASSELEYQYVGYSIASISVDSSRQSSNIIHSEMTTSQNEMVRYTLEASSVYNSV